MLCKFSMCSFALHKSRCSTGNWIIYTNMLEFWLLPHLFEDKSNVVVQHDTVPSSGRNVARCQHSGMSSCLSNGPAEEGPLPDLPSLTTLNFFVIQSGAEPTDTFQMVIDNIWKQGKISETVYKYVQVCYYYPQITSLFSENYIRQMASVYINASLQACLEVAVHAPP